MTENPQHRSGEDEFVPAGDDQVAERLAAMTEEEAEARAASLRAGLEDYELEEDDAALLDAWQLGPDEDVDAVVCCVSIDYLTRPIEVLEEAGRVLRPGGTLAITFSNRCFPTKAVRGWLLTDDEQHGQLVAELVRRAGAFTEAEVSLRTRPGRGDPLYAVVAHRR